MSDQRHRSLLSQRSRFGLSVGLNECAHSLLHESVRFERLVCGIADSTQQSTVDQRLKFSDSIDSGELLSNWSR